MMNFQFLFKFVKQSLAIKNVLLSLWCIHIAPGVFSRTIPPNMQQLIKKGLRKFLADNPDIPHQTFKVIIKKINSHPTGNDFYSFIDSESNRLSILYEYLDKVDIDLASYFAFDLPCLDKITLKHVEAELQDYYKGNMPILIIGGCGFIGSHLAIALSNLGNSSVDIIDIKEPSKLLKKKTPLIASRCEKIDITELNTLKKFLEKKKYRYIFNLASNQTDPLGRQDPTETIKINVNGLLNIITAVSGIEPLHKNLRRLVHASTDKVLTMVDILNLEQWEHLETQISTYDASKLSGDILSLIQSKISKKTIPLSIVRLCNIFGPHDGNYKFRFLPKEIHRMASKQEPPQYYEESTNDYREYLFIDDAIRILLQIARTQSSNHKILPFPGCFYEKTSKVANTILNVYNEYNSNNGKIKGSAQACKSNNGRNAMIHRKQRTSASELLSIDPNIGYSVAFGDGIKKIIKTYEK